MPVPVLADSLVPVLGWQEVYWLVGGTALFLLGVGMASDGLRRAMGGRMRTVFGLVAKSRLAGVGAGFGLTGLLQSSSASTVVLVGLADAGIITVAQSAPIILGAAVGTTLVPQILAFKIAEWGLLAVAVGFIVRLVGRWQVWKNVGWALIGFGLLFYGMHVMGEGVRPIREDPALAARLAEGLARHPWLAALAAMGLTAVIQSSGATVALAMTLAVAGAIKPADALPIVVGANVGTCATALIASVGAGHEGRKVAVAHLGFKLLAALLVLPFAGLLGGWIAGLSEWAGPGRRVANLHVFFNVAMAGLFLPFCGRLAELFGKLVPRRASEAERVARRLSAALSDEPAAALLAAERTLGDMATRTAAMFREALAVLEEGGGRRIEELKLADDQLDAIYAALVSCMAGLSHHGLTRAQAARQSRVLYLARQFEEIGDLVSRDLAKLAAKRASRDAQFTMESLAALRRFGGEVLGELERIAAAAGREGATELADLAAAGERIDEEYRGLVAGHFQQVSRGVAEARQTGSIYPDVLAALRDVRRTVAEVARVLAAGPEESEVTE